MHRPLVCAIGLLALVAGGCASKSGEAAAPAPAKTAQPIPANSPLAKVNVGMTAQEVTNVLGAPTNQMSYESGKRWIPWYFGDDVRRIEWSYKGMGRVVFTGGNVFGGGGGRVSKVEYDPAETGVRAN